MINKIKILAVGLITATAFSITNAGIITLTSSDGQNMDQSSITVIDTSLTLTESNVLDAVCEAPEGEGLSCYLQISPYCLIRGDENGVDLVSDCYFTAGEYNINSPCLDNMCFTSIEIEHDGLLEDLQNPGDDNNNTQGGVGGDNEETQNGTIIQQGTATFTPIINRLREIAKEFIPYLLYICIGAIGINMIREVIKMIMGNIKNKSKETFREGEYNKSRQMRNRDNRYISRKEQEQRRKKNK